MTIQADIEQKLANHIHAKHLEVVNESNNHNVPVGSESHFKVVIVSEDFADKKLLQRHRMINEVLAEELQGKIHALAMHTYTEAEWQEQNGGAPMSPPCLGGSAK
ncbi:Cell division protein BolA [hydrothermal vent metagenome]|uniref:Cell division protein BolA n=1 Tax=hydrothermal vent metagenome TaxID=652676 RepID=A0A3B1AI73_9ZZZZ